MNFRQTTIKERFGAYRKPTETTIPKYQKIQEKTLELAEMIEELCPNSPEKGSALTLLQQAKMSANAAIAIYSEPEVNPAPLEKLEKFRWDICDQGGNDKEIARMVKGWGVGYIESLSWNPEGNTHRLTVECGKSDALAIEEILKRMKVM